MAVPTTSMMVSMIHTSTVICLTSLLKLSLSCGCLVAWNVNDVKRSSTHVTPVKEKSSVRDGTLRFSASDADKKQCCKMNYNGRIGTPGFTN